MFDYRGWGESDARVVLTGPAPAGDAPFTAEVRPLRGYIDPFEQVEDWFNAIDWLAGEPMADMKARTTRARAIPVGTWSTSPAATRG